jgi:hypothetical protein
MGTPAYLSPTLYRAYKNNDYEKVFNLNKSDVFSLGLTILLLVIKSDVSKLNRYENKEKMEEML